MIKVAGLAYVLLGISWFAVKMYIVTADACPLDDSFDRCTAQQDHVLWIVNGIWVALAIGVGLIARRAARGKDEF